MRPQLEYASTVWDPYQQIDQIEKVQRRSARYNVQMYITGRYRNRACVGGMIDQLQLKSLKTRRKEVRLTMMYKIVRVAIDAAKYFKTPSRTSRATKSHPHCYMIPSTTKDYRKGSFFCNTVKDWNCLPPDIARAGSLEIFKSQMT